MMRHVVLAVLSFLVVAGALRAGKLTAQELSARVDALTARARAGELVPAVTALDELLSANPGALKALMLRAKVLLKLGRFEEAERDTRAVLKARPDAEVARTLLTRIRARSMEEEAKKLGKSGGTYSEWDRVYRIPGARSFGIPDFKGAEGHTLFVAPSNPKDAAEVETYLADSQDRKAYFLRILELAGKDGKPDLALPAATSLEVKQVPTLVLVDASGKTVARGAPGELAGALEKLREAVKKKPAESSAPVSTQDFSSSSDALESLAQPGMTTVVMVTSPG